MPDNVVSLVVRLAEAPPLALRERRWDECKHPHKVLIEETHRVGCSDCGAEDLDPWEVLAAMAKDWHLWRWQWEQLQKAEQTALARERASWERRRDHHLHAHPDHRLDLTRTGWNGDGCRTCRNLEIAGRRLAPTAQRGPTAEGADHDPA